MDDHAPPPAVGEAARTAILAWYAERGRPLAFRRTRDPYAVLVSEAMAQQTQAARAAEAWERWMVRYPTVKSLASAPPSDVLRQWAGLGYDRRALALWRTAQIVFDRHDGRIPHHLDQLQALPGVGPYTARAVAALAFGAVVGAVDVNVRRVLGRMVAGDATVLSATAMQDLADASVPPDDPGGWTHALMDIGATVCRPRKPRCGECPARPWCRYATSPASVDEAPARHAAREATVPFPATNRWLRGRLMTRLRAEADPGWAVIEAPLGVHDAAAIRGALRDLAHDGLIELHDDGRARLRSA